MTEKVYLDLFAELDKATEPSRELDLAISLALWPDSDLAKMTQHRRGLDSQEGYAWTINQNSVVYERWTADGRCPHNGGYPLPFYTASIDAALKLLRKHYLWQLKQGIECTAIVWWLEHDWDDTGAPTAYSTTHPALALTKAILLARAVEDRVTTLVFSRPPVCPTCKKHVSSPCVARQNTVGCPNLESATGETK